MFFFVKINLTKKINHNSSQNIYTRNCNSLPFELFCQFQKAAVNKSVDYYEQAETIRETCSGDPVYYVGPVGHENFLYDTIHYALG